MRQYCRSSLGRFPYQHAHCFSHASSLAPPLLDHSAFTSQLDEVDRLLRAFIVQRQRVRQSIPADEESDERMMDSDEESNRRWSSSTDSTAVILAPSDVLPLKTPSISETQVIPGLPRASATIQFDDKAHSFVSAFLDSNPPHTHTEFAPKNSLLYHELQPVGHVIRPGSELNVTHDHLPRPGPDSNSSSPLDGTGEPWNRLTTSGNNEGSFLAPDLETSLGPPGLVPIQEGIFAFSMDYKEGYHDAASRAGKTLMYNQRCGMKRASLPDGTLGDALEKKVKPVRSINPRRTSEVWFSKKKNKLRCKTSLSLWWLLIRNKVSLRLVERMIDQRRALVGRKPTQKHGKELRAFSCGACAFHSIEEMTIEESKESLGT